MLSGRKVGKEIDRWLLGEVGDFGVRILERGDVCSRVGLKDRGCRKSGRVVGFVNGELGVCDCGFEVI